ncbi:MAG: DUF1566 domain-containing protein [Desulfamplus sp.]|nr:DUF1566 domain-containing protein [Desulfamplus sp.]
MIKTAFCNYEDNKDIFKDYSLRGFIGKGRYGSVYLVENSARKRALKIFNQKINWEDDKKRVLNDFQSPYIIDIVDYGETVLGESCVLMEYMPLSLEHAFELAIEKGRKFSEHKACIYFTEILKGLQLQEIYGIIHRDIKPSNLFIVADTIKASDHAFISGSFLCSSNFSLLGDNSNSLSIQSFADNDDSEAFGTPAYSSPEVFDGCYSHSADRWAASVIFFQMLSGTLPFYGETILNTMLAVMDSEPDYSLIPEQYHNFLKKCFKKNPRDRHADIDDMLSEFEDILISDNTTFKMVIKHQAEILSPQSDFTQNITDSPSNTTSKNNINTTLKDIANQDVENAQDNCELNKNWPLRKVPITVSEDESKHTFSLDESGHPFEYIKNRYEANDNGTVIDHATGLIWQQSGSEINFSYKAALDYVDNLNNQSFAGYNDWRIPTISELLSLLEPEKVNGYLHISQLFDGKQQWCWSSDKRTKNSGWYVFFYSGNVNWDFLDLDNYVRAVRS